MGVRGLVLPYRWRVAWPLVSRAAETLVLLFALWPELASPLHLACWPHVRDRGWGRRVAVGGAGEVNWGQERPASSSTPLPSVDFPTSSSVSGVKKWKQRLSLLFSFSFQVVEGLDLPSSRLFL